MKQWLILFLLSPLLLWADNPAFQLKEKGVYTFETGSVKGILNAENNPQGIVSLIDLKHDKQAAHSPGLMGYYRLLSTNTRWGTSFRQWPSQAVLKKDGSVEIIWPPAEDHPVELKAIYKWVNQNTLDLKTEMTAKRDLRQAELFMASYFTQGMTAFMYAKPTRHSPAKPGFISAWVNPILDGAYLAFPRDAQAAQLFYDGRWERGPHPAHFAVTRFYAQPLAMRVDQKTKFTIVLMSRPDACFGVEMSYDKEPPDGVSSHGSIYFSQFGKDLTTGQTASTLTRMVVGHNITEETAVKQFHQFMGKTE